MGNRAARLLLCVVVVAAVARLSAVGQSFATVYPGYTQSLFGVVSTVASPGAVLGGVAVLPNGDVIAAECVPSGARLHRFSAATLVPGTSLHFETSVNSAAGCGIVPHPDGFLYSNVDAGPGTPGVVKLDPATGQTVAAWGPPGNALGIAVDPKTRHVVYAGRDCRAGLFGPTCTLYDLDPVTGAVAAIEVFASTTVGYIGGIYFDPTGDLLFLNNRFPSPSVTIVTRTGEIVQTVPMPFGIDATGIAFDTSAASVVTNNTDGTMTLLRFPKGADLKPDYTSAPIQEFFATGGFRGDLTQVGPDGCLYVTQAGARYDDFNETIENSIVRVCGGFVPPAGITLTPPTAPACSTPNAFFRLAAAAPFTVLALSGDNEWVDMGPGGAISGDVGVGANTDGDIWRITIDGKLFVDPLSRVLHNDEVTVRGGTVVTSLADAASAARAATVRLAGLAATQTLAAVTSSVTLTGNGGVNVVSVRSMNILDGAVTLRGGANDIFVLNINGKFVLDGTKMQLSGVSPCNVIWNFLADPVLRRGSTGFGTFLSMNAPITVNRSTVTGHIFSGGDLALKTATVRPQ